MLKVFSFFTIEIFYIDQMTGLTKKKKINKTRKHKVYIKNSIFNNKRIYNGKNIIRI